MLQMICNYMRTCLEKLFRRASSRQPYVMALRSVQYIFLYVTELTRSVDISNAQLCCDITELSTVKGTYLFIHLFVRSFRSLYYGRSHSFYQSGFSTECDVVLSSFNFQFPLVSVRLLGISLLLLPRLHVTSILLSIFPSITCFSRQVLCKM